MTDLFYIVYSIQNIRKTSYIHYIQALTVFDLIQRYLLSYMFKLLKTPNYLHLHSIVSF